MGTHVKKAVIASEDQAFFSHNGFDYKAIEKAMKHNEQGKKLRGGSTISQQTAKNVFLWQGRSWIRKGLEAVYTFIIELVWSKDIILERYLNSIEMGRGVFGVEAASEYYFKKNAKFIKDIGYQIGDKIENWDSGLTKLFSSDEIKVQLDEKKETVYVNRNIWRNGDSFDKFMIDLEKYFKYETH